MVINMASYNKMNGSKKSIGVIIVLAVFAVVGLTCILIGYFNQFLAWLAKCGTAMCVLAFPALIFMIYKLVKKKIEGI